MKACGLIVEYNPFHHGHQYHVNASREKTNADCMVAVMSGSFLQRGEPAIIDKFHRTKAALCTGVDLVIELPYPYAVQSSDFFAKGAIFSLHAMHVHSVCFGSEIGDIDTFLSIYETTKANKDIFTHTIQKAIQQGDAYPSAYEKALEQIGVNVHNQRQPNNILGMSYVRTILDHQFPMKIETIQRIQNQFHDEKITGPIASATSIRENMHTHHLSNEVEQALPSTSLQQLQQYYTKTEHWHHWEHYFPLLRYTLLSHSTDELAQFHGVEEGIEHRIKKYVHEAHSFSDLVQKVKTKRYTVPRLQRMFTHILTNTKKEDIQFIHQNDFLPYIRILGFNDTGKRYLSHIKQNVSVPMFDALSRKNAIALAIEERATNIYFSCLHPAIGEKLRRQELQLPIQI